MTPNTPLVTALVSTYNAESFLPACLDSLFNQTLYPAGKLEIIVVVSGSEQNEAAIARHHLDKPNFTLLETERETAYAAWNRAAAIAKGQYLVIANTDDRFHPHALELMANFASSNNADLVYSDALVTSQANETFAATTADTVWAMPPFSWRQALMDCHFGCSTLWRASAHHALGGFNPRLAISGDYEFFLRLARQGQTLHLPLPLALYYQSPSSLSNRKSQAIPETYSFLPAFRHTLALEDLYPFLHLDPSNENRTAALIDLADLLLFAGGGYSDPIHASELYVQALTLDNTNFHAANNLALAMAKTGELEGALEFLQAAHALPNAERAVTAHNIGAIQTGKPYFEYAYVSASHHLIDTLPPVLTHSQRFVPLDDYLETRPQARALLI